MISFGNLIRAENCLLRRRWAELSRIDRSFVERRIIAGPPRRPREKREKYRRRASVISLETLAWLQLHRCKLSQHARQQPTKLRRSEPTWKASAVRDAARSFETGGGTFQSDTDPTALLAAPLANVIELAGSLTKHDWEAKVDHTPFRGLIAQHPRRALGVLVAGAKRGVYRSGSGVISLPIGRIVLLFGSMAAWPQDRSVASAHHC